MMFILQKKNSFLLISFLLSSCHFFLSVEPIAKIDHQFLVNYGNQVKKAKKKYYQSLAEANYNGEVSFEKTAYGKILQTEIDFIESNAKNNPYINVDTSQNGEVEYLTYNSGPYKDVKKNIFDDIKIPNNDFKYYNLGRKDYSEINNIELQEAYDYIQLINQEIFKQMEIARLRAEAMKTNQKQDKTIDTTIIDKTKENLKTLTDKLKGIINTSTTQNQ